MPLFVEAILLRLAMLTPREGAAARRRLLEPVPTRAELRAIFAARQFVLDPHQPAR